MKKIKIAIVILLILLSIITIYASDTKHTAGEIITEGKGFIQKGQSGAEEKISSDNLKDMSDTIYNILLVAGIIIAIIVGLIMGIKFVMGGIEEKAEIKELAVKCYLELLQYGKLLLIYYNQCKI